MRIPRTVITAAIAAALSVLTFAGPAAATPRSAGMPAEAARSVRINFNNWTPYNLDLTLTTLPHGMWTPGQYAPAHIGSFNSASWESESDGTFTGTEGTATFWTPLGNVWVHWNNPWAGANSYDCWVPAGWTCTNDGSAHADNALTTFQLIPGHLG